MTKMTRARKVSKVRCCYTLRGRAKILLFLFAINPFFGRYQPVHKKRSCSTNKQSAPSVLHCFTCSFVLYIDYIRHSTFLNSATAQNFLKFSLNYMELRAFVISQKLLFMIVRDSARSKYKLMGFMVYF
jgi:hypothetical protein